MTKLANTTPVPANIKNESLAKWERGAHALKKGQKAFVIWFGAEGAHACSFCNLFKDSCYFQNVCRDCPLKTGTICAEPWDNIRAWWDVFDETELWDKDKEETGVMIALKAWVDEMIMLIEQVTVTQK